MYFVGNLILNIVFDFHDVTIKQLGIERVQACTR